MSPAPTQARCQKRLQRRLTVEVGDGRSATLRGGARLTTFLVHHEPPGGGARGCMVEQNGTRVVYSGDTCPTNRLIEVAREADVLIHEGRRSRRSGCRNPPPGSFNRRGRRPGGEGGGSRAACADPLAVRPPRGVDAGRSQRRVRWAGRVGERPRTDRLVAPPTATSAPSMASMLLGEGNTELFQYVQAVNHSPPF